MPNWDRLPTWEEVQRSGQMYRGMPKKHYAPPFGQGTPFNSSSREMSPREIENRKRDRWLYENSQNATPEDLREFGLDPQGQRLDGKAFTAPFSQGDMWKDLEQYGVPRNEPLNTYQIEGLHRLLQEQEKMQLQHDLDRTQQQQQHRFKGRQRTSPSYGGSTQQGGQNSIWNEMKNWR